MHIWNTQVQKIQQITILKNHIFPHKRQHEFKKYNKLQSLRTPLDRYLCSKRFKKYNKLQSLRTQRAVVHAAADSKNTTNYNP